MDKPGPSRTTTDCSKSNLDRLTPRHTRKRKNETEKPSKSNKSHEFKQEYKKLKTLVPSLQDRNDTTKVEIIEETIRYIDALHHRLSERLSGDESNSNEARNVPKRESSDPLRPLDAETHGRSGDEQSKNPMQSSKDLKAAIENIQGLFRVHLQQESEEQTSETASPTETT